VNLEARILQPPEVFEWMYSSAFTETPVEALMVKFPPYLPPLVLELGAEEYIRRAALSLRRCIRLSDKFLVSAHYEDRADPAACCVVMAVQLQRQNTQEVFCVEHSWLDEIGILIEELLARSVALTVHAANDCLNVEFRLPVHRSGVMAIQHRDAILLVEDDTFVRNVTREVLETAGHRVLQADNAEQALEIFDANRQTIGLVISDVTMPGKSGKELAAALQRRGLRLPILLMSGYASPVREDLERNILFLAKPYNSAALMTAIRRCLNGRHSVAMAPVPQAGTGEQAIESCELRLPVAGARELRMFAEQPGAIEGEASLDVL
jgi:CheY-like chemotaxis protein